MANYCKVTLIGNVGNDPVLKNPSPDRKVAEFSIAVNSKSGTEEKTDWFRVSVWNNQADIVMNYVKKGTPIFVEGKLRVREYLDKDQKNRTSLEVIASDFQLLGSRDGGGENQQPYQGTAGSSDSNKPGTSAGMAARPAAASSGDTDDLPF